MSEAVGLEKKEVHHEGRNLFYRHGAHPLNRNTHLRSAMIFLLLVITRRYTFVRR
jgi:hypothetical protein